MPLLDEDYLILSTVHSGKGQEWKAIFVLNAVDGCIPSDLGAGARDRLIPAALLLQIDFDYDGYCPHSAQS
jgi:DNA helicase II / ATP-dependent DNA helicase PcrA